MTSSIFVNDDRISHCTSKRFLIDFLVYLIPILGVIFLYSGIWKYDFVWDDNIFFGDKFFFNSDKISQVFLSSLPADFSAYYRPSTQVIFAFLMNAGHGEPAIFHIFSAIIHTLSTIVLISILIKINALTEEPKSFISSRLIILFWASFFSWHPAMVETVSWVSSNFDLQMTFWLLLLFSAGIFITRSFYQLISATILFFLACSSKEICITFPFVCFTVFCLIFYKKNLSSTIHEVISLKKHYFFGIIFGGTIYFLLRIYVMRGANNGGILFDNHDILSQVTDAMRSIFWYLKNLLVPFSGLGPVSDPEHIYEFQNGYLYGGIAATLAIAISLLVMPRAAIAFIVFLAALAPVLHVLVVIYGPSFVSDRYMAYPLAIFTISACTVTFSTLPKITISKSIQRLLSILLVAYVFSFATISHSMIPMWRNNLSLWSLLYARHPYSTFAFSQMIASYGIAGDCNRVEKLTESSGMRSAAIDGTVAKCIVDKDPSKAILLVERALAADVYLAASQMTNLLDTLAYAHELLKNYDKSLEILEDIMHAYPDFHPSRIRHIEVLMKACRHNDADLAYNETLSLFSESERAVLPGYQKIWQTEYDTHCPK